MKPAFVPVILLAVISLAACSPGSSRDVDLLAQKCRTSVTAMYSLTEDLEIPAHLETEQPEKQGDEFDVNRYFDVLTNLSMEPGYSLDYTYEYDGLGGWPMLYARQTDPPASPQILLPYPEHVRVTDTVEGYLEFVLLNIMADQFYLYWHANYNDSQVLCDQEALNTTISRLKSEKHSAALETRAQKQAKKIDPRPVVTLQENSAQVQVLIFTQWGGFIRWTYIIQRDFPHTILEFDTETLVPYDSGILF